jgi:hypothetical protein
MNPPLPAGAALGPSVVAQALEQSIQDHLLPLFLDPNDPEHRLRLARWGRPWGVLDALLGPSDAHDSHGSHTPNARQQLKQAADRLRPEVSPHPHRFDEVVQACKDVEERFLRAQVERLEGCGTVWWRQHVLRIFWTDRTGRERLRKQIGIHRCKQAWCPACGRTRQAQLTEEVEKLLLLARDFGLDESHGRLVTLTVPNGASIFELRDQAHQAFAKLQRTRWWNRHAFGWVRGTEVVTGQDGNWNLHVHLLALFWCPKVSYRQLGEAWTRALGGPRTQGRRFVLDCESLESHWGKRGGLLRAARYITKYLTKPEEFQKLMGGPGGLAHLVGATHGLRRFAVGGGCSLLRRAAGVLLPRRAFSAEEALAGTWLHEGRGPWRVEAVDPDTGEVGEVAPERLQDRRQEGLAVWGGLLETNPLPGPGESLPGRVVGVPCGPHGKYRRVGELPFAGPGPTVKDFERKGAETVTGIRRFLGPWKVFRWTETSAKTGKELHFAAVLPATRYAWREVWPTLKKALASGPGDWVSRRKNANVAASKILVPEGSVAPRGWTTGRA